MHKYAGYMAYSGASSYTSVRADFTVPAVTCGGEAAFWDGIGSNGYLAQTGVDAQCINGTPTYYAFAQFFAGGGYPIRNNPNINNPVAPGDKMSATTRNDGRGYFTTTLVDRTAGWTASFKRYIGDGHAHAAEVFVEDPPYGTNELADFGSVKFSDVKVDGSGMARARPAKYNMVDASGNRKATTGGWDPTGHSFTVTWNRRK